jgi:hypothetical protein
MKPTTPKSHPPRIEPQIEKPSIVCLCGSRRFAKLFAQVAHQFTQVGIIVLAPHWPPTRRNFDITDTQEHQLEDLHMWRIRISQGIHVINPKGYIGPSTARAILYAKQLNRTITYDVQPHD